MQTAVRICPNSERRAAITVDHILFMVIFLLMFIIALEGSNSLAWLWIVQLHWSHMTTSLPLKHAEMAMRNVHQAR